MRGTDYLSIKPKGHPVQPTPEELLKKAKEIFSNNKYENVYVATEEKRLFEMAEDIFGKEHTKQNKRMYYDEHYSNLESGSLVGKVKFNRENDNYLKGLEYISSLVILSKCDSLVAGGCGGTDFSVHFGDAYNICYVFDLGVY